MNCTHCGAALDSHFSFCPHCGKKTDTGNIESPKMTETIVAKKPMPFWFKIVAGLAVLALVGVTAGILFTESWVDVVDHQLKALRNQNIEKAYSSYTSKEFQEATNLEQFRTFIEAYPVFFNNQSAHFSHRSIEHNIGTLRGNLTSNDHITTPIEYKLIKENDTWKILSIRLLKPNKIQNAKGANHQELIEVVKNQLKDLQENNFAEAYNKYSSKEFKAATTEETFHDFINRYPIFTHYQMVSFHKPTIRNGVGTISVILQSEKIAAYLKYFLIFEDHSWKIWSMRILSPSEAQEKKKHPSADEQAMHFGHITIGDQMDEYGKVKEAQELNSTSLNDLYVDIEIINGIKGGVITITLKHIDSGSAIPAKATIEENGDTILLSVFSPPSSGWPKGHYQLEISTSYGLSKSLTFEIE